MPRSKRVEFVGGVYHVMARGNEGGEIFRGDDDRRLFLMTLGEAVGRFCWVVRGYCLMANHYHLIVETPAGNLSRGMAWFQTTYVSRFNQRYGRCGHLFQGRFKSSVIDGEDYGRQVLCYVHLNPVRPKNKRAVIPVDRWDVFDSYRWSSHGAYRDGRAEPGWLDLGWLKGWGGSLGSARKGYCAKMRACFGEE